MTRKNVHAYISDFHRIILIIFSCDFFPLFLLLALYKANGYETCYLYSLTHYSEFFL